MTRPLRSLLLVVAFGAMGCAGVDSYAKSVPGYANESAPTSAMGGYAGGDEMDAPQAVESRSYDFADEAIEGEMMKPGGAFESGDRGRIAQAPPLGEPSQPSPEPAENTPEPAPATDAPLKRMKIYTGQLNLQVVDVSAAETDLLALTEKVGGFMASKSGHSLTLRVPVDAFFTFVAEVKKRGQLLDEQFNVQDVTRQAFELQLRIDTALKARTRLTELLSKAVKVEDILKIENEIRRLTQEIEVLKGSLRQLVDQASYSTLTINLFPEGGGPAPQPARTQSPFNWINQSGPARAWRMPTWDESPGLFEDVLVPVPEGFLAVGIGYESTRALNAEEARFWVRQWSVNGGDLKFWEAALRKEFTEGRKLVVTKDEDITWKGQSGRALTIDTEISGRPMQYYIVLFRGRSFFEGEQVLVVELLSPPETFERDVAAFKAALR